MKIVIFDSYTANPGDISWDEWKELGAEFVTYDRTAPEQVVERAKGAEIVLTNKVLITREVMEQLPELRYVGVFATGYNVVDIAAAHEKGITVTNIPAYSTMSVAQMVFAHVLNITNNVAGHAAAVRNGMWEKSADFSFQLTEQQELSDRIIGIVGLGNTGTQTARIALSMGMKVLAFTSKTLKQAQEKLGCTENIAVTDDINKVFTEADIVSLHCPLTDSTHHMVNSTTLSLMKPTAILINTGRGPLIEEQALADALTSGRIYAAGIDVLTQEPPRDGSPLIALPNCHITPHIAWATTAARHRLLDIALGNVKAFMAGKATNVV